MFFLEDCTVSNWQRNTFFYELAVDCFEKIINESVFVLLICMICGSLEAGRWKKYGIIQSRIVC